MSLEEAYTHAHTHTEFRVDDDVSSNFEAPACADYGMCTDSEIELFIYGQKLSDVFRAKLKKAR